MAGLPRSGSTVLSAILNQNPEVYASPQTDLVSMLYLLESEIRNFESFKARLMTPNFASTLHGLADTFYAPINKPVVIDKNRGWGTPYNFDKLSGYVNPEGKVILTMRPILEVLASFIKISKEAQKKTQMLPYLNDNLWLTHYRTESDAQVDNLMRANGEIDHAIFSIANLLKNHKDRVHIVWFDDLINDPKLTITKIHKFLELDVFEYDFENIKPTDIHNDLAGYGIPGLHNIKKKITKSSVNPKDYLSEYAIEKYKNTLDFLVW